jgi:hypothetical protein
MSYIYKTKIEGIEGEVELTADLHWENSGIGWYQFGSATEFDAGQNYLELDDLSWDKTLYTEEQNKIIGEYIDKNMDELNTIIPEKAEDDYDPRNEDFDIPEPDTDYDNPADDYIYARGGYVSKGELVWRKLNASKRMEFLYENFTPEITPRGQELLVGKDYNFLPRNVKMILNSKYANVEEYSNGGGVGSEEEKLRQKMNIATHTKTGNIYVGGLKRKNILYKDDKGFYLIERYEKFIDKKYPIKKYFTDKSEIEILEKVVNEYANGGGIPNMYRGKTAEKVWDSWTERQRKHFCYDHELMDNVSWKTLKMSSEQLKNDNWGKEFGGRTSWDWIKNVLQEHIEEGQYKNGGGVNDVKSFVANKEGIIEIYSGSDARSAEVKIGDTFIVTEEMKNGIYYLGKLKTKGSFKLDAGLSGKDVSESYYGNQNEILYLLRKQNIGGDSDFFAQFKKIQANGGGVGEELMGGQPNSSRPSGYTLVQAKGREIIVTDDGGKTKEIWIKNNGYSGYTLHYNGNQYEFVSSGQYANGGGVEEYADGGRVTEKYFNRKVYKDYSEAKKELEAFLKMSEMKNEIFYDAIIKGVKGSNINQDITEYKVFLGNPYKRLWRVYFDTAITARNQYEAKEKLIKDKKWYEDRLGRFDMKYIGEVTKFNDGGGVDMA